MEVFLAGWILITCKDQVPASLQIQHLTNTLEPEQMAYIFQITFFNIHSQEKIT